MAKKGQKFKRYTQDEISEYLKMYKNGYSSSYFEKNYEIPANTIRMWNYKFNHPELLTGNKRGKQRKELTKEDWKERYEIVKKYQAFLMAQREKK